MIPAFTFEGFFLGPVYIYTWGLTAAIGVLATIFAAEKKLKNFSSPQLRGGARVGEDGGVKNNQFWSLVILLVISVFLGARVSYILETWSYYNADPLAVFQLWEGGFSFFGGAVGVILAGYIWSRLNKIDFLYLGWLFTPAWLFGLFFGRLGCFLIHDHLGKPTDLPWGVFVAGAYRHEPALYEAVLLLLIGGILYLMDIKIRRKFKNPSALPSARLGAGLDSGTSPSKGEDKYFFPSLRRRGLGEVYFPIDLFPLSLLLYSVGRFLLDFLRADDPLYFGLTVSQWACIIVIVWTILTLQSSLFLSSRVRSLWRPSRGIPFKKFERDSSAPPPERGRSE